MTTTTPRNCDRVALRRRHAFGTAIRNARIGAGLQQWRLAELAGCDRQSICRIETGAYAEASLSRTERRAS